MYKGRLRITVKNIEVGRMDDLFRSATLLKLRPPAASSTLFFAASFSFFRDSSKSSYIDMTKSMLRQF